MAALMYTPAKVLFLAGSINLGSNTIKAVLVKSAYTADAAHDFLDDLSTNAVGTAATLASKTTTAGVFDAADVVFSSVGATGACNRVAIYKHVNDETDSPLLALLDLAASVTPDGGDITVVWSAGGIFAFTG